MIKHDGDRRYVVCDGGRMRVLCDERLEFPRSESYDASVVAIRAKGWTVGHASKSRPQGVTNCPYHRNSASDSKTAPPR